LVILAQTFMLVILAQTFMLVILAQTFMLVILAQMFMLVILAQTFMLVILAQTFMTWDSRCVGRGISCVGSLMLTCRLKKETTRLWNIVVLALWNNCSVHNTSQKNVTYV